MVLAPIRIVLPSGAALATKSAPILPLAPGMFCTTTLCPIFSASWACTVRAMVSMPVPGVKGTMILMGTLLGCAKALQASTKLAQHRAKRWRNVWRVIRQSFRACGVQA